ncbi:hypothetical protein ACWD48_35440 [Streptomyces sp. NPDC002519]
MKNSPQQTGKEWQNGRHKNGNSTEVVDSLVEDGEITRVVEREGADHLPTLARLDPYADHLFDAYWCELMLMEISRLDLSGPSPSEGALLEKLARWAKTCVEAPEADHVIRFTGD